MKYWEYDILDFISDEFFIRWVQKPDENTGHFWEKWIKNNPGKRKQVMEAITFIRTVKYPETPDMNDKMYVEAFESIINADRSSIQPVAFFGMDWLLTDYKKIGGLILLLFGCILGYQLLMTGGNFQTIDSKENFPVTCSKAKGKRSIVHLEDQSRIFLNSESEIQYPIDFSTDHRWLKLNTSDREIIVQGTIIHCNGGVVSGSFQWKASGYGSKW